MSKQYEEKQPTGREYVDKTVIFNDVTHFRCDRLPVRWKDTLLIPLLRCTDEIETCVCKANKIYINQKNMDAEALTQAYNQRMDLLKEAISLFADFDIKFDRLMRQLDISGSERKHMRAVLYRILDKERKNNPDLKNINIKITTTDDGMEYRSLSGTECDKIRLTPQNRDYWLDTEHTSLHWIRYRLNADKKAVSRLNQPWIQGCELRTASSSSSHNWWSRSRNSNNRNNAYNVNTSGSNSNNNVNNANGLSPDIIPDRKYGLSVSR